MHVRQKEVRLAMVRATERRTPQLMGCGGDPDVDVDGSRFTSCSLTIRPSTMLRALSTD